MTEPFVHGAAVSVDRPSTPGEQQPAVDAEASSSPRRRGRKIRASRVPRTDAQRSSLRRILMLSFVPIALFAVIVAAKFISVNVMSSNAQTAYSHRAYAESAQHARGLQLWNFLETWKAPFDLASGLAGNGELEESRSLLEHSLALHGDDASNEYCVIVTNLVFVIEKQGDAAREDGDQAAANGYYNEALQQVDGAPENCSDDPGPNEANTQEQLNESTPRIEEKIDDGEGGSGGEDDESGEGSDESGDADESEAPSQQEQLEEQNQGAQEQQQQQDEYYQEQEDGDPNGGGVEHPW